MTNGQLLLEWEKTRNELFEAEKNAQQPTHNVGDLSQHQAQERFNNLLAYFDGVNREIASRKKSFLWG